MWTPVPHQAVTRATRLPVAATHYGNTRTGARISQLAASGSAQALPAGWLMQQSRTTGDTYYVNTATGHSTYERPTAPAPEHLANSAAVAPRDFCLICSTVVSVVVMTVIVVAFVEDGYAATPSEAGSLERCRSAMKPFGVWLKVVFSFLALDLAKGWIARCRGVERCCLEGWPLRLRKLWSCLGCLICGSCGIFGLWAQGHAEETSCESLDEPPMVYHLVLALGAILQVVGYICVIGWVCAILASPALLLRHAVKEEELTKRVAALEASVVTMAGVIQRQKP